MLSPRFSLHTVSGCGRPGFSRLPLLTSAVLIGACLACSGEATDRSGADATEGVVADGATEDTLTIMHYSANVDTWQDFGMSVLTLLFEPLMHVHDGEIEGRLATRREMSPDGRSWTYHLRTDARWHDGTPFTAHDVKFTIDLFQDPDFDNPAGVQAARGASVDVIDDSTLTLTFGQYRSDYWVGREVFLPKHLLEDLDPSNTGEWEFWESPVGNGPYRFVRMVPNQLIELEANPDYFLGEPAVGRVFIRVMGNARTELQAGQVDVWSGIGPVTQGVVAQDPRFQIYRPTVGRATSGIHWNHRHPILGDPVVRRALTMAIDRSELVTVLGTSFEGPFVDVLLSGDRVLRGDLEGVPEPLGPDPESARELLQDAGWKDADGDGVLERGGRPLRFTLLGGGEREAVVLREQFRRIGVEVELATMGREVLGERFSRGDFEAMIFPVALRRNGHGLLSGTADSIVGYASEEMRRLEARLDTTFLVEERERIYAESWPIFQCDIPVTLLIPNLRGTIANARLRGVSERDGVDLVLHLDEVWLEDPDGPER
jgi:peptide/nickel transport system substrate-binding protein